MTEAWIKNNIERHAAASVCPRHLPQMRGCAYEDGKPCACRKRVERRAKALAELAAMDAELLG